MKNSCKCGIYDILNLVSIGIMLDVGVKEFVNYHVLICEKSRKTHKEVAEELIRLISPKLEYSMQEIELIEELKKIS